MTSLRLFVCLAVSCLAINADAQDTTKPKYSVKVSDDKTVVVDLADSGAVDPQQRINFGGKEFGNGA